VPKLENEQRRHGPGDLNMRRATQCKAADGRPAYVLQPLCSHAIRGRYPPASDAQPQPHVGLSTVAQRFEETFMHRASVGAEQAIHPGAINGMRIRRGITRSEQAARSLPPKAPAQDRTSDCRAPRPRAKQNPQDCS